ncbi:hypothetical protein Bhyg_03948, partial [Pseudolycoriella hygida]
ADNKHEDSTLKINANIYTRQHLTIVTTGTHNICASKTFDGVKKIQKTFSNLKEMKREAAKLVGDINEIARTIRIER